MRSLVLTIGLLAALPAAAQEGYVCKKPPPGAKLRVNLAPGTTLADLGVWVMSFTCKDVVYADELAPRTGKITVVSGREMTPAEAYQLFVDAVSVLDVSVEAKGNTLILRGKAPSPPASTPFTGARKIDDTHYELSRKALNDVLDGDLGRGARIVPAMKDGKPDGYKLYAIRPSSVYAGIGLQNGDTIYAVNGLLPTTPEQALEVYVKLKAASQWTIQLRRRGNDVTLQVKLVDP